MHMVLLRLYTNRGMCVYSIYIYNSIRLSMIGFSCLKIVSPVGGESGCAYLIPGGYFNDSYIITDLPAYRNNSESIKEEQNYLFFFIRHLRRHRY